jgi:hypothetical protein
MKFRTTLLITTIICWAICAVVIASTVWASPFLTCDCSHAADTVTGFQLQFGSQTVIDTAAVQTCLATVCTGASKVICYDLGTIPQGAFSVKALAKNDWGVSEWTNPLAGNKQLPTSPLLLKIVK